MSEKKIKLYFDCDTGIDDAMALGYLLAESDKVDILAIGTVCGNVAADAGARNTLELARLAGFPAIPVAVGERDYLRQAYLCDVQHIHGDNGIGDIALEASNAKLAPLSAPNCWLSWPERTRGAGHLGDRPADQHRQSLAA